jgi:hypothetical protein
MEHTPEQNTPRSTWASPTGYMGVCPGRGRKQVIEVDVVVDKSLPGLRRLGDTVRRPGTNLGCPEEQGNQCGDPVTRGQRPVRRLGRDPAVALAA